MRRGFKAWSEGEAERLRQELGIRPDSPLAASALADHLGVLVIKPEQVPGITPSLLECLLRPDSGWSAVTVAVDGSAIIIHNSSNAPMRQESDLMHELAHIICKHPSMRIVTLGGMRVREYSLIQEEEAAWLGGCLQLPRVALWSALRRGLSTTSIVGRFNASEEMVRYRRNVTGIDAQLARMHGH